MDEGQNILSRVTCAIGEQAAALNTGSAAHQEHTKMIISSSHAWMNDRVGQVVVGVVIAALGAYLFV